MIVRSGQPFTLRDLFDRFGLISIQRRVDRYCRPGVGAAWVFTRAGTVWSQQAKLVGTGAIGAANQGFSVSLSGNGSTAIVGGPYDIPDGGAAWVYAEPIFAGTPGKANCYGQSVAALAKQYGGLNAAAAPPPLRKAARSAIIAVAAR